LPVNSSGASPTFFMDNELIEQPWREHNVRPSVKLKFGVFLASIAFMFMASPVLGCSCGYLSPEMGVAHAEAVFTGKVIRSSKSNWDVEVDRVWKGDVEKRIELFDAHAGSDCSTRGFKKGRSYLFLMSVENRNGKIRYSPQPCNWTTALKTLRITVQEHRISIGEGQTAKWTEEWVLMGHGQGKPPLNKVDANQ